VNRLESIIRDIDNFSSKRQGKTRELLYKKFLEGLRNDATVPELKEILRIIDPPKRETAVSLTEDEKALSQRTAVLFNEYVHEMSYTGMSETFISEVRMRLTELILSQLLRPSSEDYLYSLESVWTMLFDCDAAIDEAAEKIVQCLPIYFNLIKNNKLKLYKYIDALIYFKHQAFQMPLLLAMARVQML